MRLAFRHKSCPDETGLLVEGEDATGEKSRWTFRAREPRFKLIMFATGAPPARVAIGWPDRPIIRPSGSGDGISEHLAVNRFNPRDLVIGQRGKFLFLAAVGKSTAILVQESE